MLYEVITGFERFKGWDNQLHNEPGLQLLYEHKHRVLYGGLYENLGHDLITHAGASLVITSYSIHYTKLYDSGWVESA